MAFIQYSYGSPLMKRDISMEVILPFYMHSEESAEQNAAKPFKTVYFLHGFQGSAYAYMRKLLVAETAAKYNLAIVAVNGENLAYVDCEDYDAPFSTWIGTELLEVTRGMFPLSEKREDTYISGFSMGGCGALINGLRFSDRFSKIAMFAPGLTLFDLYLTGAYGNLPLTPEVFRTILGTKETDGKTYKNPYYVIEKYLENQMEIPKIYMAIGDKDPGYSHAVNFSSYLDAHHVIHTFSIQPGERHTPEFFNRCAAQGFGFLANA